MTLTAPLTRVAACLAFSGLAVAQNADVLVLNDSFDSMAGIGDDQLIRLDDTDANGSYLDAYETNLLFEFSPASAMMNYEFVNVRVREEGGEAAVYLVNNRFPGGFRPEVLRGEDLDGSGRIEPAEMVQLIDLELTLGSTSQGAEGVALHPDGSVWAATDFPGGGLVRYQGGSTTVYIDDNAGATQTTNQSAVLATVDTDDFTRLSWAGNGVIAFIDGFAADRTEAVFKFEDANSNGAVNDTDELTPFLVPTDVNPNWAANPDFGTVLRSFKIPNPNAGMPDEPPFFVGRLNHLSTQVESSIETYYFACDSSSTGSFAQNEFGAVLYGLVYRGQDNNLDGDCNDAGEVTLFYDGTIASGGAQLDKVLGVEAYGGSLYVLHLAGASAPSVSILTDLNADGDALDAGEIQFQVWDESVLPDLPVWEAFLFADGMAAFDPDLLAPPLSQDAELSGVGCAPFAGPVPQIGGVGDFAIGSSTFRARITNGNPSSVALLLIGNGGPWLGIPTPVDLGLILGLPGCFLYQNAVIDFTGVTSPQGEIEFPLALPNNPNYQGVAFPMQGAVLVVTTSIQPTLTRLMEVTAK